MDRINTCISLFSGYNEIERMIELEDAIELSRDIIEDNKLFNSNSIVSYLNS